MTRRIYFITIFALLFGGPLPVYAESAVKISLDQAIFLALVENRNVLLKAEDVKKAKLKIEEAKAEYLPTIVLSGSWSDTLGLYSKNAATTGLQVSARQYLSTRGRVANTVKVNEYGLAISKALLDKTKLELVLQVRKAFFTLLLADEFSALNKKILLNAEEHFSSVKARVGSGEASASEFLVIKSSLAGVRSAYENSLNQVESAQALLRNLLYFDEGVRIKPVTQLSYDPKELAFEEALLDAVRDRPEIRQAEAQNQANKKAIEVAKSGNRPSIYASWDYYSRSNMAASLTKNWNDYSVVGVTVSWPIFDGWATKAKVEQAIVDLKASELTQQKTVRDIALELKDAYLFLRNSIHQINASKSEVDVYEDNLATATERSGQGIMSSLDLSDASLKCDVAFFNAKQAVYDYAIARSAFDKARGEF
jgi:outer membrane protein